MGAAKLAKDRDFEDSGNKENSLFASLKSSVETTEGQYVGEFGWYAPHASTLYHWRYTGNHDTTHPAHMDDGREEVNPTKESGWMPHKMAVKMAHRRMLGFGNRLAKALGAATATAAGLGEVSGGGLKEV